MPTDLKTSLLPLLRDPCAFAEHLGGVRLRSYQRQVAEAITASVLHGQGLTFVVILPRQSGKNELQAQIEAYLLVLFSQRDVEMVKVSPTWKPQSLNAVRRLERTLKRNPLAQTLGWSKEQGYMMRVGRARMTFLSGAPTANIVGATANLLLMCDEAQDVQIGKWDRDVAPMAASTNATRVFWGTAWTSDTLLYREFLAARQAEQQDGLRRTWRLDADAVASEVPAYGLFVQGEIARHGRSHPFVRTQYFSEEIDAQSGMFPPERMALMRGMHARQDEPAPGAVYAFLIDVGGEDALAASGSSELDNPRRDSSVLTIIEVDFSPLSDPGIAAPGYRVVHRRAWLGDSHTRLYANLLALAHAWQPRRIVIDATGVGAGLASFLSKALPGAVIAFEFTPRSKSELGWGFLNVIETGRYQEYAPSDALQERFWQQCRHVRSEIMPGPGKHMRWGVPDGRHDPLSGELLHDDFVLSAALCAVLDGQSWGQGESAVIPPEELFEGKARF